MGNEAIEIIDWHNKPLGVAGIGLWLPDVLNDEGRAVTERVIGQPIEAIMETFASLQKYLLDLGEEAQQLLGCVK